jgi:hypothetical protein
MKYNRLVIDVDQAHRRKIGERHPEASTVIEKAREHGRGIQGNEETFRDVDEIKLSNYLSLFSWYREVRHFQLHLRREFSKISEPEHRAPWTRYGAPESSRSPSSTSGGPP